MPGSLSRFIDALGHDLRFSLRSLARSRGLAAMVTLLLAIGLGANAAMFGMANELFLKPPAGVSSPGDVRRLVARSNRSVGHVTTIRSEFFFAAYSRIVNAVGARAALAGYSRPDSADSRIAGSRGFVRASYVTPQFFAVLRTRFTIGRGISEAEGRMGEGQPVAVISHDLWQSRFHGSSDAIGQAIEISGQWFSVIGVTAQSFTGVDLDRADVWLPFAMFPWPPAESAPWYTHFRKNLVVRIIARLAPGVSEASVAAAATAAYRSGEIENVRVGADSNGSVLSAPLLESLGPSIKPATESAITKRLIGVALIVLVVACANVANLLLLRGVRRRREIALRLALGISRRRLMRQLLLESLLLSAFAAVSAILVGALGASALRSMLLPSVHWATSTLTVRLVAVSFSVALFTGLAAGLVPAIRSLDGDLTSSLKSGARDGVTTRSKLRATLMVLQAALSVVLLVGAGLFIRSLDAVRAIDVGYDADRLAYGTVMFRDPVGHFLDFDTTYDALIANGLSTVAQRLSHSPNIERVALSWSTPMAAYAMVGVFTADRQPVPRLAERSPALLRVSPEYFAVTGVRLARGRLFTAADVARGEPMIVVNETAARVYWPGKEALGQCLHVVRVTSPCFNVIGVVRDAHLENIVEGPTVEVFQPMQLGARVLSKPSYVVMRARSRQMDEALAELRRELARTFPTAEPPLVRSVARAKEPELRPWRLGAALFTTFGLLALAVATIGVYSVMAFTVSERTHEMGVRIALGARSAQVARLVVGQGVWPVAMGVALGIVLSLALGRVVADLLYGTKPGDPFVFAAVCALLVGAGALGALAPAWRATRVNPVIALRAD